MEILQIAASVAVILFFAYWIYDQDKAKDDSILSFALQTTHTVPVTEDESVLILSGKKQVSMKEDEATISYSNQNKVITVQKDDKEEVISQEETFVYNQLVTPKGKRSTLILADGSKIWLNAGTQVIYPKEFQKDKREIFVNGEIYIEVTPDKERPFFVKTRNLVCVYWGLNSMLCLIRMEALERIVLVSGFSCSR